MSHALSQADGFAPESGRCARCKENTVLERVPCEDCKGRGWVWNIKYNRDPVECADCEGNGYTKSTPCCGSTLIDEGSEVDRAYDMGRDLGWR